MSKLVRILIMLVALLHGLVVRAAGEESIALQTGLGVLAGSLMLPSQVCPCPVALIIAGSGPTDRDGNSAVGLHTDSYKLLASVLAEAGIASVRYDKRGVAGSSLAGPRMQDMTFETYVDDARAWLLQLAADARFSGIAVLGHSEGSLVGMLATSAADDRKLPVRAFVSLSGLGQSAADTLRRQTAGKLPLSLVGPNAQILAALEAGKRVDAVPSDLQSLYRPDVQPFLIDWFRHRPAEVVARLTMPTLIVQGDRDTQVTVEDARLLQAARPQSTLLLVPGMTHTLKHIDSDAQQLDTYRNPALPLDPKLLDGLIPFLRQNLKAPL